MNIWEGNIRNRSMCRGACGVEKRNGERETKKKERQIAEKQVGEQ